MGIVKSKEYKSLPREPSIRGFYRYKSVKDIKVDGNRVLVLLDDKHPNSKDEARDIVFGHWDDIMSGKIVLESGGRVFKAE